MRDRDLIALTTGGLLLTSGLKRAENAAMRSIRADVLRRVNAAEHLWRRRASNAVASLTVVVGGLVLLLQFTSQRRNGVHQGTDGTPSDADPQP